MPDSTLIAKIRFAHSRLARRFWSSETAVTLTFAVIVGIGAGLGTIAFVRMISFSQDLFFGRGEVAFDFLGGGYVILLPILGGLLVGPIVHFIAPEAKGHGVPEVLTAIATRGGRIRPVVVLAKAIGSAITIGSGGSVGREGPIVQIGAAWGSTLGQFFKLNERRVINLVAAGAAGGIAATFNAPIAGVIFAAEVILADFTMKSFSGIVISAVTASVVSRAALGDSPAFAVPTYSLVSPWELGLYLGLGVVAAVGALAFVKSLYFMEDLFDDWKFPPYLKPAVGGLALGLLGYLVPQIFGTGFGTIEDALNGQVGLTVLAMLVVAKILATSFTLGSGSSGGVFAPALFIGAVLGGAYGELARLLFPGVTAPSGAYAMVGMAAVFAAAARAPITAIIILFEMTHDYRIILPLMFATVVSTILASRIEPESIYTLKLMRRGLDVRARKGSNLMNSILVSEAMTPLEGLPTVTLDTSVTDLSRLFRETMHHGFVVLDHKGELLGVVTLAALERALEAGKTGACVRDIYAEDVPTTFPDETLDDALRHFDAMDVGRIPVVDRQNPRRLVGLIRHGDVVGAYSRALTGEHHRDHHMARLRLEAAAGAELYEIDIEPDDAAVGMRIKELGLPADCVVVSIRRGNHVVVPRGNTQIRVGDRLIAMVAANENDLLTRILRTGREQIAPDGEQDRKT